MQAGLALATRHGVRAEVVSWPGRARNSHLARSATVGFSAAVVVVVRRESRRTR